MTDVVTPALAKDWIPKLWKQWSTIRTTRATELQEITNELGDPELLKELYVEPDCQMTNPADLHEEEAYRTFRQPIRRWINGFLEREFFERDGRNTLFVLSDAGMGKTSLLMMLKLTHLMRFWASSLDFKLMRLGNETLKNVERITAKNKTVLLLDALDEDEIAWGRIEERLSELLHATKSFRQVVVTCRTQFFPKGGKGPIKESPEKIEVAGFVCNLIYLSPFNDALFGGSRECRHFVDTPGMLLTNGSILSTPGAPCSDHCRQMSPMLSTLVELCRQQRKKCLPSTTQSLDLRLILPTQYPFPLTASSYAEAEGFSRGEGAGAAWRPQTSEREQPLLSLRGRKTR